MRRKLLFAGMLVGCLVALGRYTLLNSPRAQDAMLARTVAERGTRFRTELLQGDSLYIVLVGTGSPLADPGRASACIAVFAGGRAYLIDTGPGAAERLQLLQLPMGALAGVFITHLHSDHIGDLGQVNLVSWALGRREPLAVYGPPGVERVADGYQEAYALDATYRIAHHHVDFFPEEGALYAPRAIDLPSDDDTAAVLEDGELRVSAFRVSHEPVTDAYGYRIDYRGRSVIFSGDTVPHPNLTRVGRGVDVMVHEGLAPHMVTPAASILAAGENPRGATIFRDIPSYHTPPVEAARLANEAGARLLVFSHVIPPLPNAVAERMFLRGVDDVRRKDTIIGWDGLVLELPTASDAIIQSTIRF